MYIYIYIYYGNVEYYINIYTFMYLNKKITENRWNFCFINTELLFFYIINTIGFGVDWVPMIKMSVWLHQLCDCSQHNI